MAAPTLRRRLLVAQALGSLGLLAVFGMALFAERNSTVAHLAAQRWAPALRGAAGLDGRPTAQPRASEVRVLAERPAGTVRANDWAPRIAALRDTLRDEGVPVVDIASTLVGDRPLTWIEVALPAGGTRWLGFDDEIVVPHVVRRTLAGLLLGFAAVSAASALLARRLTRPLEALRRRIESHQAPHLRLPPEAPAAGGTPTLEIAAIEAAWDAMRERLERQEGERALLLAGVSHDLRSPLARIRMAAELLPEEGDAAVRRASIVRNVDVADRLIASFLEYVRAGELPLESTVDLVAVATRLLAARDEPTEVLSLTAPSRLDVPHAHELLLERLLANLVDNAMRHGRPPVRVRIARDGDAAVLEVEDHGPGIAPEDGTRLTQAFARGDASRGRPGTGLGLAVVLQVVRRMGGTLSFERVAGAPCVRVRLPA